MSDTPGSIGVSHYGIHETDGGVFYLHQGGHKGHNFIGMGRASPFSVVFSKKRGELCPHDINPSVGHPDRNHWDAFLKLYEDDLFRECLPIPKQPGALVPYVNDPNRELGLLLATLSRLASPVVSLVHNITRLTPEKILEIMTISNVAPIILTGINTEHQRLINQLVAESLLLPRKIILCGSPDLVIRSPMRRIVTRVPDAMSLEQVLTLPLETLGAVALRRHCRHEQINSPFTRKEEPHG